MQFTKRLLMGLGGVALVATLVSMCVPRSVHALVATLVQVSNTPSNPVPTADVHTSAGQNIELYCSSEYYTCPLQSPQTGALGSDSWVVPDGMSFVVTDVEAFSNTVPGKTFNAGIWWGGYPQRVERWYFPNNELTNQLHFTTGIVVPPGAEVSYTVGYDGALSWLVVHGYLTPN